MRYKRKQSKTEKTKSVLHAGKHRVCTQKMRKSKYTKTKTELQNTRIPRILFWTGEMLLKLNWEFFSCRRCFLSFHLKVKVVKYLISSGIEDHTFRPTSRNLFLPTVNSSSGKCSLKFIGLKVWSSILLGQ